MGQGLKPGSMGSSGASLREETDAWSEFSASENTVSEACVRRHESAEAVSPERLFVGLGGFRKALVGPLMVEFFRSSPEFGGFLKAEGEVLLDDAELRGGSD